MGEWLYYVAVGVATAAFVAWLAYIARREDAVYRDGWDYLTWPRPVRFVAVLAGAVLAFGLFLEFRSSLFRGGTTDWVEWSIIVALMLLFGFLNYLVFFYRLRWNEHFIETRHPLGGTRLIPWEDIVPFSHIALADSHYVKAKRGGRIWFFEIMVGFDDFWDEIDERVAL